MTDTQLKLEVLKLAIEVTRETMYARRTEVENAWERRTEEIPFPKLPTVDVDETVKTYQILMEAICK